MRGWRCGTPRARASNCAPRASDATSNSRANHPSGRVNGLELLLAGATGAPRIPKPIGRASRAANPRVAAAATRGTGRVGDWCDPDRARRRASEPARPSAPRLDPPTSPGVITSHLNTSETSETVACGPGDMDAAAALSDALTADRPVGIRAAAMSDHLDELARLLDAGVPVDYPDGAPGTPSSPPWRTALPTRPRSSSRPGARWTPTTPPPAAASSTPPPAPPIPPPALVLRACHAACVPMDARDHAGRTPLEIAMRHRPARPPSGAISPRGAYRVLVAILDAGASPDVPFSAGAHPSTSPSPPARVTSSNSSSSEARAQTANPERTAAAPRTRPTKPAGVGIEPTTSERANARGAVGDRPRGARRRDDAPWFDGGEDARGRRTRATPLLLAVSERRPDLVTTLMDAGADPELAAPFDAEAIRAANEAGGDARWTPGPDEDSSSPEPDAERNLDANGDRSTTTNEDRSTATRASAPNPTRTPSSPRDIVRDVDETARAFSDSEGSDSDPSNRAFRPQPRARTGTEIRTKKSASAPRLVRPLQLAASLGDVACASALMDAGARLDVPADMPPLVCAAAAGASRRRASVLVAGRIRSRATVAAPPRCTTPPRGATRRRVARSRRSSRRLRRTNASRGRRRRRRRWRAPRSAPRVSSRSSSSGSDRQPPRARRRRDPRLERRLRRRANGNGNGTGRDAEGRLRAGDEGLGRAGERLVSWWTVGTRTGKRRCTRRARRATSRWRRYSWTRARTRRRGFHRTARRCFTSPPRTIAPDVIRILLGTSSTPPAGGGDGG